VKAHYFLLKIPTVLFASISKEAAETGC